MLVHGLAKRTGKHDSFATLVVDRTGPYVPPVSKPYDSCLVFSDAGKLSLTAHLEKAEFQPVELGRVSTVKWHLWDFHSDEPKRYPPGGEPENYFSRSGDQTSRDSVGTLWELLLPLGAQYDVTLNRETGFNKYWICEGTHTGPDLFYATRPGSHHIPCVFVTDVGRDVLGKVEGESWLTFDEVEQKPCGG